MKLKIQIVVESDSGDTQIIQEVTQIDRNCLQPENLGISLAEAKILLQNTQKVLVEQQITEYEKQHSKCQQCEKKLLHKDKRFITYRTLFGKLQLKCNRLFHCNCTEQQTRTFNPVAKLLSERTSPELLYLESKFASLMSYGLSSKLLQEVLPIEGEINATSIRNNLHAFGKRLDSELPEEVGVLFEGCPRDWEDLPKPDLPLVVGMDGGYVRFYDRKLSKIEDLIDDAVVLGSEDYDGEPSLEAQKLWSHLEEFETYISNNGKYIANYGDRYHNGERISSSFVESTVNQVISKRFVKKQQMRWTPEGTHLLIQVRTQVLNKEWAKKFQSWYPGLNLESTSTLYEAA